VNDDDSWFIVHGFWFLVLGLWFIVPGLGRAFVMATIKSFEDIIRQKDTRRIHELPETIISSRTEI
jgi:hypothetical protein